MLQSKIPQVSAQISLALQRVVHETGEAVEYNMLQRAQARTKDGNELRGIHWRPSKSNPHSGVVVATTFYTRFSEYGTVHQAADPMLQPAANEERSAFAASASAAIRMAAR